MHHTSQISQQNGRAECLKVLLEHNANPNQKSHTLVEAQRSMHGPTTEVPQQVVQEHCALLALTGSATNEQHCNNPVQTQGALPLDAGVTKIRARLERRRRSRGQRSTTMSVVHASQM